MSDLISLGELICCAYEQQQFADSSCHMEEILRKCIKKYEITALETIALMKTILPFGEEFQLEQAEDFIYRNWSALQIVQK